MSLDKGGKFNGFPLQTWISLCNKRFIANDLKVFIVFAQIFDTHWEDWCVWKKIRVNARQVNTGRFTWFGVEYITFFTLCFRLNSCEEKIYNFMKWCKRETAIETFDGKMERTVSYSLFHRYTSTAFLNHFPQREFTLTKNIIFHSPW